MHQLDSRLISGHHLESVSLVFALCAVLLAPVGPSLWLDVQFIERVSHYCMGDIAKISHHDFVFRNITILSRFFVMLVFLFYKLFERYSQTNFPVIKTNPFKVTKNGGYSGQSGQK